MAALELGSNTAVMAAFELNPNPKLAPSVEIIDNMMGHSDTKVIMSYQDKKERLYGKSAVAVMRRVPDRTYMNLQRLIDVNYAQNKAAEFEEQLAFENRFCTSAAVKKSDNRLYL